MVLNSLHIKCSCSITGRFANIFLNLPMRTIQCADLFPSPIQKFVIRLRAAPTTKELPVTEALPLGHVSMNIPGNSDDWNVNNQE